MKQQQSRNLIHSKQGQKYYCVDNIMTSIEFQEIFPITKYYLNSKSIISSCQFIFYSNLIGLFLANFVDLFMNYIEIWTIIEYYFDLDLTIIDGYFLSDDWVLFVDYVQTNFIIKNWTIFVNYIYTNFYLGDLTNLIYSIKINSFEFAKTKAEDRDFSNLFRKQDLKYLYVVQEIINFLFKGNVWFHLDEKIQYS